MVASADYGRPPSGRTTQFGAGRQTAPRQAADADPSSHSTHHRVASVKCSARTVGRQAGGIDPRPTKMPAAFSTITRPCQVRPE